MVSVAENEANLGKYWEGIVRPDQTESRGNYRATAWCNNTFSAEYLSVCSGCFVGENSPEEAAAVWVRCTPHSGMRLSKSSMNGPDTIVPGSGGGGGSGSDVTG